MTDRLKTDVFQENVDIKETKYEYNKHKASLEPSSSQDMICDERHIAKLYHAPYVKWMSNSKVNPPDNWECY